MMVDVLAHSMSTWTTGESSERNDGFMFNNSLHVGDGLKEVESSARSSSLIGVLEMGSQVIDSAFSGFAWLSWFSAIFDHWKSLTF